MKRVQINMFDHIVGGQDIERQQPSLKRLFTYFAIDTANDIITLSEGLDDAVFFALGFEYAKKSTAEDFKLVDLAKFIAIVSGIKLYTRLAKRLDISTMLFGEC